MGSRYMQKIAFTYICTPLFTFQFEVAGANLPKPCMLKLLSSPLLGPGLIARDAEEAPRTGTGRVAKTEIALVALCLSSLGQPEWTLLSKW